MSEKLLVLYPQTQIEAIVKILAAQLNKHFAGKKPIFIGVLKGSFIFLADLVRGLNFSPEIDFVRLASYGNERVSSTTVKIIADICLPVEGRDILLVEDIIDTGKTIAFYTDHLKNKKPASISLCTLLDKPSRRVVELKIDFLGLKVPDLFLVGYGLDFAERYRNLRDICALEEKE